MQGANLEAQTGDGRGDTPLHVAARHVSIGAFRCMLGRVPAESLTVRNDEGDTVLDLALRAVDEAVAAAREPYTPSLVHQTQAAAAAAVCLRCGAAASKKCGKCQSVSFCGSGCLKKEWKTHKLACHRVAAAKLVVKLCRKDIAETDVPIGTATDQGIWFGSGVPSLPRFALSTAALVKEAADRVTLDKALACEAPHDGPVTKKAEGNGHFARGEYEAACRCYTEGLEAIFAINALCTKLHPARANPDDPAPDGWPELHPNLHYWNSQDQTNGQGVEDPGTCTIGGRAMYFGPCLHRGHPLIELRAALLSNRAACHLKAGRFLAAVPDCAALLEFARGTHFTHPKALHRRARVSGPATAHCSILS